MILTAFPEEWLSKMQHHINTCTPYSIDLINTLSSTEIWLILAFGNAEIRNFRSNALFFFPTVQSMAVPLLTPSGEIRREPAPDLQNRSQTLGSSQKTLDQSLKKCCITNTRDGPHLESGLQESGDSDCRSGHTSEEKSE
jgi:hypothetical protein